VDSDTCAFARLRTNELPKFNQANLSPGLGQTNEPPLVPQVLGGYLLTEAKLGDDLTVSIYVFTIKVIKKTAALTDHFQQAASAAVVVLVLAQMVR